MGNDIKKCPGYIFNWMKLVTKYCMYFILQKNGMCMYTFKHTYVHALHFFWEICMT